MELFAKALAGLITGFTRLLTGAKARWIGCAPIPVQRIYYGNHSSHGDFVLIWASLPPALRIRTRPVAGADYWENGRVRRFIIHEVLHGVLIGRDGKPGSGDPIETMVGALDLGYSLILFPEGARNTIDEILLPFKSGLYRVASQRPAVELIPVWIENLGRVLPKGEAIPVPLLCSITFGAPIRIAPGEQRAPFLERTRRVLLELAASMHPD